MILNNQYNFIFLKQRRTSSTTLEIVLSAICFADDIISGNNSVNESYVKNLAENLRKIISTRRNHTTMDYI